MSNYDYNVTAAEAVAELTLQESEAWHAAITVLRQHSDYPDPERLLSEAFDWLSQDTPLQPDLPAEVLYLAAEIWLTSVSAKYIRAITIARMSSAKNIPLDQAYEDFDSLVFISCW